MLVRGCQSVTGGGALSNIQIQVAVLSSCAIIIQCVKAGFPAFNFFVLTK